MVVAALCEQILPSARGLARDKSVGGFENGQVWHNQPPPFPSVATAAVQDAQPTSTLLKSVDQRAPTPTLAVVSAAQTHALAATRQRKKRFRATKCLASLAADFDLVTDWVFYFHCRRQDIKYREEYQQQQQGGNDQSTTAALPYLIPSYLLWTILVVCILGTILWLVLATDGAVATPVLRRLGFDKLSMGYVLFLGVLVEDIPQVILTFLVEDFFEEGGAFTSYALVNVFASMYDTLIKLAEAFDERADVVETGIWCKQSIWAHRKRVTCVVPLPRSRADPSTRSRTSSMSHSSNRMHIVPDEVEEDEQGVSQGDLTMQTRSKRTLLQEAREIVSETKLPRLRFLSASMDGTAKLWDTGNKVHKKLKTFRGHRAGVSCIAVLGYVQPPASFSTSKGTNYFLEHDMYFLTGSHDGTSRLWNARTGECLRSYTVATQKATSMRRGKSSIKVSSIAYLRDDEATPPRDLLVTGFKSGVARLWEVWSGVCLSEFRGHSGTVHSISTLQESHLQFATASSDCTIKVWSAREAETGGDPLSHSVTATDPFPSINANDHINVSKLLSMVPSLSLSLSSNDDSKSGATLNGTDSCSTSSAQPRVLAPHHVANRTLIGHMAAVLSVASVSSNLILSGSADRTARLWSLETGDCLRIFLDHTDAVTTVSVVDSVTFMTGSSDSTVKVWDAMSASLVRNYTGHSGAVTSVTPAANGTFISAAADQTIKLWIFTAVLPSLNSHGEVTLQEVFGMDENACCACAHECVGRNNAQLV